MSDFQSRATKLAALMGEFGLSEASLEGADWKVAYRKKSMKVVVEHATENGVPHHPIPTAEPAAPAPQQGTPISSPMTGIYYSASSPSSPPFVEEGDTVEAGQVVALIEAMKVFNEITSPVAGRVLKMAAENGALVSPGEPLIYVG